jgi:GNAT superfamily N-acetyltransferase
MLNYEIRAGRPEDVDAMYGLICELAAFERALPEVINSSEQLLADGFGENPLYGVFVAEAAGKVVGMALYYYRYSTWKGKVLYLEDLYIQPEYRHYRIGQALLARLKEWAVEQHCQRISLQVLDWNEPAIAFYQKSSMSFDPEWVNVYLEVKDF